MDIGTKGKELELLRTRWNNLEMFYGHIEPIAKEQK